MSAAPLIQNVSTSPVVSTKFNCRDDAVLNVKSSETGLTQGKKSPSFSLFSFFCCSQLEVTSACFWPLCGECGFPQSLGRTARLNFWVGSV